MSDDEETPAVIWFWVIVIGGIILIWFGVGVYCSFVPHPCLE